MSDEAKSAATKGRSDGATKERSGGATEKPEAGRMVVLARPVHSAVGKGRSKPNVWHTWAVAAREEGGAVVVAAKALGGAVPEAGWEIRAGAVTHTVTGVETRGAEFVLRV